MKGRMTERGTGKTTSQIKNLEDGGLFIVHSINFVKYCQTIADKLGRKIDIVPLNEVKTFIMGREFSSYDIDHYTREKFRIDYKIIERIVPQIRKGNPQ